MSKATFQAGLAAGIVSGMSVVEKHLVGYAYSLVTLTPFPEYDKEKYPYAAILNENGTYYFRAFSQPLVKMDSYGWFTFGNGKSLTIYSKLTNGGAGGVLYTRHL